LKEKRSLFDIVFGKRKPAPESQQPAQMLKLLNGFTPHFTDPSANAFEYAAARSAVDAIARNGAKLKPKHIRRINNQIVTLSSPLDYILSVRPNPHMDAYSFYYKLLSQLYYKNNAFAYWETDGSGNVKAIYPIDFSRMELLEYNKQIYVQFHFLGGDKMTLPYSEVIHLRRFFYGHEIYGDMNSEALQKILGMVHTTDEGIINAIKSSAYLRGLLSFNTMLNDNDFKKTREKFADEFFDMEKKGGIAAIDARATFTDLKAEPKMVSHDQMSLIESKVYKYFNVSEPIVKSEYNEEQWNSFYESVIEPLAIQLSLEFTAKLFSNGQKNKGNEIVFESNRLQYASNKTKIEVVQMLMDRGMMSVNQGLEVFNLPPVEGGDKFIMSLNFVDKDIANQYQLGKQDTPTPEPQASTPVEAPAPAQDVGGADNGNQPPG
jgi:HK97 family phage portal protein